MKQIILRVEDEQKALALLDYLAQLDYVCDVDVVESNGANAARHQRAYPQPAISPDRPAMLQEQEAFDRIKPQLLEKYSGQYVAIFQGQVIDHDSDEVALVARRQESHPNDVVLITLVSDVPEPILHFRSPRFIRD